MEKDLRDDWFVMALSRPAEIDESSSAFFLADFIMFSCSGGLTLASVPCESCRASHGTISFLKKLFCRDNEYHSYVLWRNECRTSDLFWGWKTFCFEKGERRTRRENSTLQQHDLGQTELDLLQPRMFSVKALVIVVTTSVRRIGVFQIVKHTTQAPYPSWDEFLFDGVVFWIKIFLSCIDEVDCLIFLLRQSKRNLQITFPTFLAARWGSILRSDWSHPKRHQWTLCCQSSHQIKTQQRRWNCTQGWNRYTTFSQTIVNAHT